MSEETTTETAEAGKRPMFLTVICILSFIGAGFAIFGYIIAITAMGAAQAALGSMEALESVSAAAAAGPSAGMTWAYVIVGFLTTIVALFGVIKMWKLDKQGFMLYAGANVVSIIMGMIYSGFGVAGMIMPIIFIVMFYLNLKHMKD
jgi:hypothetical protein